MDIYNAALVFKIESSEYKLATRYSAKLTSRVHDLGKIDMDETLGDAAVYLVMN